MVIFEGCEYDTICRLNGGVLQFRDGDGTMYVTVIPITSKKKRMKEFTNDYAKVVQDIMENPLEFELIIK